MSDFSVRRPIALVALLAAGAMLLTGLGAWPATADDGPPSGFPTWAQVQQAKGNTAATASEVTRIQGLLDGLETQSEALGAVAVQAGAEYARARTSLEGESSRVGILNAQLAKASKEAGSYQRDVAAIAAQSYKSGGTSLGLFSTLATLDGPDSLANLDLLHQVGEQAAAKQARAHDAQGVADSLTKAARSAEAERQRLAAIAAGALEAAETAQRTVTDQLAAEKDHSTTLYKQLAVLKNTSASVEQGYRQGQEQLAAYNAAQQAKQAAAEEAARKKAEQDAAAKPAPKPLPQPGVPAAPNPGTPVDPDPNDGFIPIDVLLPNIPGGAVNDPAGAQAYASSRLGAYGWSSSEFSCLSRLWTRESSWLTNATNPTSGAYGIAQALAPGKYASAGSDWLTNYRTQIEWGLGYIRDRYGSPCGAWAHSEAVGWY